MIRSIIGRATVVGVLCAMTAVVSAEEFTLGGIRTELNRADLTGVAGMEVIVSNFVVKPGGIIPLHTHPGDEHYTVIQGSTLTTPDGKIFEIKDGFTTNYPRDQVHGGVTNTGDQNFVITTIHIMDKGKPMFTLVN